MGKVHATLLAPLVLHLCTHLKTCYDTNMDRHISLPEFMLINGFSFPCVRELHVFTLDNRLA